MKDKTVLVSAILITILLVVLWVGVAPLALIMGINMLGKIHIAYSLETWFGAFLIICCLKGASYHSSSK